jgi:hypothetical protein
MASALWDCQNSMSNEPSSAAPSRSTRATPLRLDSTCETPLPILDSKIARFSAHFKTTPRGRARDRKTGGVVARDLHNGGHPPPIHRGSAPAPLETLTDASPSPSFAKAQLLRAALVISGRSH